jgi:putative PIN family toxin of toxin-antitoxin system
VKVVLDTDVVVAAMRSPRGASAALLLEALAGRLTPLLGVALAVEYEGTCMRAEHRLAAGLSERDVGVFLDAVVTLAEPVESHFLWRPSLRDPADEMVLEAAVGGHAEAIVTFNVRDFAIAPRRFGIEVLRPAEALRRVRR